MVIPKKAFMCGRCDKVHSTTDDALNCCPTEIHEVFLCGSCGNVFDTEDEAKECCGDE